jgi:hypothetical protein
MLPAIAAAALSVDPAGAASLGACQDYVKTAVESAHVQRERRCGFAGPRWKTDPAGHMRWCRRSRAEAVAREHRAIFRDLARCTTCSAYAKEAARETRDAARLGCGYSGPRWASGYGDHLGWCLRADGAAAASEQRERKLQLFRCYQDKGVRP